MVASHGLPGFAELLYGRPRRSISSITKCEVSHLTCVVAFTFFLKKKMHSPCTIINCVVLSIRKLYNSVCMNGLSGSRGKQGKLDVQRDPPIVDVEPCTGDEPVPGAVLRPHGHLRGVHEPEHLLRGDGHRRSAGEHAGVDVDDALRRVPLLLRSATATATTGRARGGGGRQEAAGLPRQPRHAARPPGLHDGAAGELGVEEPEVQHVGGVVRRDVELRARHDTGRARVAVSGAAAAPPCVVLDRRGAHAREHPPLDRLVVPVVGGRVRTSPHRRFVVPRGGDERRGGR
jgi:hypothetical protein